MKQIAIIFLFISQIEGGRAEENIPDSDRQTLEKSTINVLELVAKGDIAELKKTAGKWAVGGTMCSEIVFPLNTRSRAFKREVWAFQPQAVEAGEKLKKGELNLEFKAVEDAPPGELLKNGDVIVREECEWGLLFRLDKKKQWRFKGFFLKPLEK